MAQVLHILDHPGYVACSTLCTSLITPWEDRVHSAQHAHLPWENREHYAQHASLSHLRRSNTLRSMPPSSHLRS